MRTCVRVRVRCPRLCALAACTCCIWCACAWEKNGRANKRPAALTNGGCSRCSRSCCSPRNNTTLFNRYFVFCAARPTCPHKHPNVLCRDFNSGRCTRGAECTFIHAHASNPKSSHLRAAQKLSWDNTMSQYGKGHRLGRDAVPPVALECARLGEKLQVNAARVSA